MVSQQNSDPPVIILFFVSKLVSVCFLVHSKYFFLLISYEETGPQNLFVYHVTIFIVLLFHSDSQNRLSSVLENNRELCTALGMMRFKLIIYFVIHVITEDGFAELAFATWGEGNFCPSPKRFPPPPIEGAMEAKSLHSFLTERQLSIAIHYWALFCLIPCRDILKNQCIW